MGWRKRKLRPPRPPERATTVTDQRVPPDAKVEPGGVRGAIGAMHSERKGGIVKPPIPVTGDGPVWNDTVRMDLLLLEVLWLNTREASKRPTPDELAREADRDYGLGWGKKMLLWLPRALQKNWVRPADGNTGLWITEKGVEAFKELKKAAPKEDRPTTKRREHFQKVKAAQRETESLALGDPCPVNGCKGNILTVDLLPSRIRMGTCSRGHMGPLDGWEGADPDWMARRALEMIEAGSVNGWDLSSGDMREIARRALTLYDEPGDREAGQIG